MNADFRQRLTEYLEAVLELPDADVTRLERLAGGTSRESWLVELKKPDGTAQTWVLRRDLATTYADRALYRDQEFRVIRAAAAAGVQVPAPRFYCVEPCILDAPFLVMDYVSGSSIGREVLERADLVDARKGLPAQLGEQLARIHALDRAHADLAALPVPRATFSPAQEALAEMRAAILRLGVHNPTLEFGLRWLEKRMPACPVPVVLHGDFRLGNFIISPRGLEGIIDWEFAHVGDPAEDLACISLRHWRYHRGDQSFAGMSASAETFYRAYEAAGGRPVNRAAVAFWSVWGNLRWAILCLAQSRRHLSGHDRSVELASLGRQSAEFQLEMLRLIAEQGVNDDV